METKYKPVLTKKDFVRRYEKGEFGNRSPTWPTIEAWACSMPSPRTLYHIRNRIAGGETWYDVPGYNIPRLWYRAKKKIGESNLYISAMAPTKLTVIQGEVRRSVDYLDLTYSTVVAPMRTALATETKHANWYGAYNLLRANLDDNSWWWLWELLNRYLDHVVEFSTYSKPWGTLPNFNTVFWEVRKY